MKQESITSNQLSSSSSLAPQKCHFCKKAGHTASDCPTLEDANDDVQLDPNSNEWKIKTLECLTTKFIDSIKFLDGHMVRHAQQQRYRRLVKYI
mgnify:CR=1 FL=1